MELMQLEMLVAVAEEHTFLRAAERVFRTQPAVSMGIRKLEGRMGVPLLDRSSRRTGRLTPAGERLYEYARKILGLRDEALSAVKGEENHPEGTLSVGLVGEESLDRFPALWKWFKQRHPDVEVKILSDRLGTVLGELADGRLDVAVISGRPKSDALNHDLVATRVAHLPRHACMWVLRQKLGKSSLAHQFEKGVLERFPARAALSKPEPIALRRIRALR